jgi:hypothetical protein
MTTTLVHCYLLGGVAFGEAELLVVLVLSFEGVDHCSGTFFL